MKALIFDSGPLINFSMNGMLNILEKLREKSKCAFLITEHVKEEVFDHPVNIPKFELGALRIQDLIKRNVLQMPESLGIKNSLIGEQTRYLTSEANKLLRINGIPINIVSEAEMSCFALSKELTKKGYETLLAVDERTALMLSEKPENLVQLMSERLHKKVTLAGNAQLFKNFNFVRSSELIYVAYKKGLVEIKDPKILEALILATKFKGSSISWDEINVLKKL